MDEYVKAGLLVSSLRCIIAECHASDKGQDQVMSQIAQKCLLAVANNDRQGLERWSRELRALAKGDPSKTCKHCGEVIPADEIAVRASNTAGNEWRYHARCLAFQPVEVK